MSTTTGTSAAAAARLLVRDYIGGFGELAGRWEDWTSSELGQRHGEGPFYPGTAERLEVLLVWAAGFMSCKACQPVRHFMSCEAVRIRLSFSAAAHPLDVACQALVANGLLSALQPWTAALVLALGSE